MSDVPEDLRVKILAKSLHRCCICHHADVQIHHIEGRDGDNPHRPENLVPICPNCHSQVEGSGGLGRKYSASELRKYRDDWFERVEDIRERGANLGQYEATGSAPRLPEGVPPSEESLYLKLDAIYPVLDMPINEEGGFRGGNEATLKARELVRDLLGRIQDGERPRAERKMVVADAVETAGTQVQIKQISETKHLLDEAVEELRR